MAKEYFKNMKKYENQERKDWPMPYYEEEGRRYIERRNKPKEVSNLEYFKRFLKWIGF